MTESDVSISNYFDSIEDPRRHNIHHKLIDIMTIAICAIICGAEKWTQVQEYGRAKLILP